MTNPSSLKGVVKIVVPMEEQDAEWVGCLIESETGFAGKYQLISVIDVTSDHDRIPNQHCSDTTMEYFNHQLVDTFGYDNSEDMEQAIANLTLDAARELKKALGENYSTSLEDVQPDSDNENAFILTFNVYQNGADLYAGQQLQARRDGRDDSFGIH